MVEQRARAEASRETTRLHREAAERSPPPSTSGIFVLVCSHAGTDERLPLSFFVMTDIISLPLCKTHLFAPAPFLYVHTESSFGAFRGTSVASAGGSPAPSGRAALLTTGSRSGRLASF